MLSKEAASLAPAPVTAKPVIDLDTLFALRPDLRDEAYMYLHCHVPVSGWQLLIRVWTTTFLVDSTGNAKSGLIHAENITYAPLWTLVPENQAYSFLLIFGGLPKTCRVFDLVEEIGEPGGFYVPGISRNERDVYHVTIR